MTASILKFTPKKRIETIRAPENIEIAGLMIRGFGYAKNPATGKSIYNATLTDFEKNTPNDLPLVVQDADNPDRFATIDTLASGEAIAVMGYLESSNGESYFVVEAVTQIRQRDIARDAAIKAYLADFDDKVVQLRHSHKG